MVYVSLILLMSVLSSSEINSKYIYIFVYTYNIRYVDDTTLMAESDEELKSCLMQVKEESENVCLKINIHRCQLQKKSMKIQQPKTYGIQ